MTLFAQLITFSAFGQTSSDLVQDFGDPLVTDAAQITSNASDDSEGQHLEYLIDDNGDTFWHSDYHNNKPTPHYVQFELYDPVEEGKIVLFVRRRSNVSNGNHLERCILAASEDGDTWENLDTLVIPNPVNGAEVVADPVVVPEGKSYLYIRVIHHPFKEGETYNGETLTGDHAVFFHAAEMELYNITEGSGSIEKAQILALLNTIYEKYEEYEDDAEGYGIGSFGLGLGTAPGQYRDAETWAVFQETLSTAFEYLNLFYDPDYNPATDPDALTVEGATELSAQLDSLFSVVLDSEVPITLPYVNGDGYYRIIAHNRFKSDFDPEGFVDKAISAAFDATHAGKAVYGTIKRDRADYLWRLVQNGDSIAIQNAGMGTYISFASDNPENKVLMTDDPTDASHVYFDYAGLEVVMPEGVETEKDCFAIRLAGKTKKDNRYIHMMSHSSFKDDSSPWGNYGKDSGQDIELGFWRSTYNYATDAVDRWASEWYLEYVPEDEAEELIANFELIKNHDLLVEANNELRAQVLEALTTAKDYIKTGLITSADQMTSPYSCDNFGYSDGQTLASGCLIDGDKNTYWHTDYKGNAPEGSPYVQLSGMTDMVDECEFYLCDRNGGGGNYPTQLTLYGANDPEAETWNEIVVFANLATGNAVENTRTFNAGSTPYEYVRVAATAQSFWHASELQIFTVRDNPNSQFASMGQVAEDLDEIYNQNASTPDADITPEMYNELLEAFKAFMGAMVDPTELRNALATYANVTNCVVAGTNPGTWSNTDIATDYEALYTEVDNYDKAGLYNATQNHKYALMLKAMQKSVMEQANGIETDKWYHITFPTEEMYTDYGFSSQDPGGESKVVDNPNQWGYYVVSGIRTDEKGLNDNGEEVSTGKYILEFVGKDDVREGMSMYFANPDDIEDLDVSMFRFIEKEQDAADYAPLLADVKENMALALDMSTTYTRGEKLITDASQLSSNASDPSEGLHIEYLIDGNINTFWHSDYHKKYLEPGYIQVALNEPVSGFIQVDMTRRQGATNGHIVRMYIQGSNDAETWTNVGYLETPFTNQNESVTSQPVDLDGTYSYLRFTMTYRYGTDGGGNMEFDPFAVITSADDYNKLWTYFHAAEFQIYPVTPDTELSTAGQALEQAFVAANKIVLKDATAEDVAAAAQAYRAYRTDFNTAEGKDVLPYGKDKADPVYAIQNKATGLFVNCKGGNNANNSLEIVPTFFDYKAIGFQRSLLHGTDPHAGDCTYLHSQNFDHRFVTWDATTPNSNSGLVICEAEEAYETPTEFTFYRDIKPGKIHNWCGSVTITPGELNGGAAYTLLGRYQNEQGDFLALKTIETIPAGSPAFYIYGDTIDYDSEADDAEPLLMTMPADEELVLEGDTINGLIGVIGNHTLKAHEIYFSGNHSVCIGTTGYYVYSPNWGAVLDMLSCPNVDPEEQYDFSICLDDQGDTADGVENIPSALDKISKVGNIYSMDGKLLRTGATLNTLKTLGSGMYIFNGVKVFVK